MKPLIAAVLILLAASATGSVARAETVVIRNDGGGLLKVYRARRAELARVDAVRIEGKCLSACAIYTTLPNACVMPDAKIGFHGSSINTGQYDVDLYYDMRMGEYFRGAVRRAYLADWRHLSGRDEFHVISGTKLHQLDPQVRLCKAAKKTKKKKKG